MLQDDVQDLQADRLVIRDSLVSPDASAPRPTVHFINPHLDPYVSHRNLVTARANMVPMLTILISYLVFYPSTFI